MTVLLPEIEQAAKLHHQVGQMFAKAKPAALLLLLLLIIAGVCHADPCLNKACGQGTCNNGACSCPPGWSGESCEVQGMI
jgi:hypothetical protein